MRCTNGEVISATSLIRGDYKNVLIDSGVVVGKKKRRVDLGKMEAYLGIALAIPSHLTKHQNVKIMSNCIRSSSFFPSLLSSSRSVRKTVALA